MLKFVLINERKSNRKLPKIFASKNLRMTHKKANQKNFIKKDLTWHFKKQMRARPLNTIALK